MNKVKTQHKTRNKPKATYQKWISETLDERVSQQIERLRHAKDVKHVRIMPDVHLANDVCIGCVLATDRLLYPAAIGSDIGCGMLAQGFNLPAQRITAEDASTIFEALHAQVPITKQAHGNHDWQGPGELSCPTLQQVAAREGRYQLGTLGRGNHFLELQVEEATGDLWVMIHTGSRSIGPAIRRYYEARSDSKSAGMPYLDANTELGQAFLSDMVWARAYAQHNRRLILQEVHAIVEATLGGLPVADTLIDGDHNHVEHEQYGEEHLWVHRKGASASHLNRMVVIPGSMGAPSFHVMGLGSRESLCSSSHGAGRCMSREEARSRISVGRLLDEVAGNFVDARSVSGLVEEAPSAYKNVLKVMKAQRKLVKVKRRLMPVLTYKG